MIDRLDIAASTKEQQEGRVAQLWPIVLDVNGRSLNSPWEIDINPCDAIWLPATYDKSYGVNPLQTSAVYGISSSLAGQNTCDVWDIVQGQLQFAAVWGFKFNSPNNPWLLWTLSTLQLAGPAGTSSQALLLPTNQGGGMRSISGPISRMWVQLYRFATRSGQSDPNNFLSKTVLISSLGFNQQTDDSKGYLIDQGKLTGMASGGIATKALGSGGYQMAQMNTFEREMYKRMKLKSVLKQSRTGKR